MANHRSQARDSSKTLQQFWFPPSPRRCSCIRAVDAIQVQSSVRGFTIAAKSNARSTRWSRKIHSWFKPGKETCHVRWVSVLVKHPGKPSKWVCLQGRTALADGNMCAVTIFLVQYVNKRELPPKVYRHCRGCISTFLRSISVDCQANCVDLWRRF